MDREELAAKRQAGQEEDRYSVARFVEKHWVALIGILTAGVAVISAVINFMAYMSQYLYLKQWNVNDWFLAKAELGPTHFYVLTAFFYCVSGTLVDLVMSREFTEHYTSLDRLIRRYLKVCRKRLRRAGEKERENQKAVNRELRKYTKRCVKITGWNILWVFAFLLIPAVLISVITQSFTFLNIVAQWILLSVCITLLLVWNVSGRNKEYRRGVLKKRAQEACDQSGGDLKKAFQAFLGQYFGPGKTKDKLGSDASVVGIVSCIAGGLVALFVFVLAEGPASREPHWTYEDNGTTYAVVYHVDDVYVLEQTRPSEDGKTILVDTARQRILSGSDITIEYVDTPMEKLGDQ